jgi:hypothetical protein
MSAKQFSLILIYAVSSSLSSVSAGIQWDQDQDALKSTACSLDQKELHINQASSSWG